MPPIDWHPVIGWLQAINWQTLAAILALLFSVYSFWKTYKISVKQAELLEDQKRLNRMLVEKEEADARNAKRADLSANLVKLANNNYRVKVFNRGKAPARNVRIDLATESDDSVLSTRDVDSKFPMEQLEPQQGVDLIASLHMNSPSKIPIDLTWDDDTGTDHRKTVYLTH